MSKEYISKGDILVVDDTPNNLRLLAGILTEEGYDIRPASDGEFALQSARTILPELILLDIKMPGMDGYTVCKHLKADERTREIPVIFISALGEVEDKVKGFEVGGVDYITKPFQPKEVLARMNTHLMLRNLQKNLQQEIDKRKQAEDELRVLNRQLEDANASKDKFFSIIAHDLRGPFTGLLGLTEVLAESLEFYSEDKITHFVSQIHKSAGKVYALLTNLLEWSRLQRNLIEQHPMNVALHELTGRNAQLLEAGAEQKQIRIRNLVPEGTMVYADRNMLDTTVRNLVSNALKFTKNGGNIAISATPNHQRVEIAVSDTGIGIPQEKLPKLFRIEEHYQRAGTANESGTGLGLALCKELIEKNDGTIWIESDVEKGTTVKFTLPKSS